MALDLFGLISRFFDPIFLVLATVFGYFIFFVFFYGTKHWKNTQWGDRLLFSVLLGFAVFVFFVSWVPLVALSWTLLMQTTILSDSTVYSISTFAFLVLILLLSVHRSVLRKPLHSTASKKAWSSFFQKYKLVHLIKFDLFWLFFVLLIAWQYPLSEFLLQSWIRISFIIGLGSFFIYSILPLMLSNLTYAPDIRFDMFSVFLKDIKEVNIKKVSKQLIHIAIVFLVALSITSFDSQIGLFTPKIALIESIDVVGDTVYFHRYGNMETLAVTRNEMTLHIIPPLLPSISINFLKIADPSIFTSAAEQYKTKITSSNGLDYSLDSDERTLSLTIEAEGRSELSVKLEFYNQLNVDSVVRIEEKKDIPVTTFPNGTKVGDYYFKITNLTPYDLYLESVTLMYLGNYNVTAFSYDVEWEPKVKGYCNVYNETSWAYLYGRVGAKVSLAINIKVLFEER